MYRWTVIVPFATTRRLVRPLIMMSAHTMILHVGYRSFPGYFLDDKQYHSRQISWRLQSDDRLNLTHLRIVRMPSPVQSIEMLTTPLQNGRYGAVWSMDTHNRSACV
ncbi:hypothetical protein TNCV_2170471 [Trichonephila clavipes]|nr:hypothetical protein TNCV_2170471 [Trichonephila clavipes]